MDPRAHGPDAGPIPGRHPGRRRVVFAVMSTAGRELRPFSDTREGRDRRRYVGAVRP
jgi:hypothetical protein